MNDKTRKIDVSLAHRRKLCSRNKDQVAQLKFDDNDIADQARNDVIEYKLVSNEDYQKLLNRSVDSIQLPVCLRGLTTQNPWKNGIGENTS